MTAPWEETTLPIILARYQLNDIFNADEFGLFYEALPSKSLHFWGNHFSGGKHSKVRWTRLDASKALGEKIPMFLIERFASPRCFKRVCNISYRYWSQNKAWVDGTFFEKLLHEVNRKFRMEARKVVIIVNNYPAHPEFSGLKAINLQFLPPNTTPLYTADGPGGNQMCLLYHFLILLTKSIES